MKNKGWTWAKERAATILWLREMGLRPTRSPAALADLIEEGEHVQALGELSAETSSPRRKRSAK